MWAFSIFVLIVLLVFNFLTIEALAVCDDCVEYTSCAAALEPLKRRDMLFSEIVRKAFCGLSYTSGRRIAKVCCSHFQNALVVNSAVCDDCVEYTSCAAALGPLKRRDMLSSEIVRKAFCGLSYTSGRRMAKVCCSHFQNITFTRHPNARLLPDDCGKINYGHKLARIRIIGGSVPTLYEYPWMALISYSIGDGYMFRCSGTIINSLYILTAAHCVVNRALAGVRVGDLDYSTPVDCQTIGGEYVCEKSYQDIDIEDVIPHPSFSWVGSWTEDIALLRLKNPIDFKYKTAAPICLPITEELRLSNITNDMAVVAGWGKTENQRDSTMLMKVEIPVISKTYCDEKYERKLTLPSDKSRLEGKICAGSEGKDSCVGDSGGPLFIKKEYNNKYRYVLYGIVSEGPKICGSSLGLYTDVAKYLPWILDNIKS